MNERIEKLCRENGIVASGICDWENGSVLVALFPYYAGEIPDANISRYAWAKDYHIAVKKRLEPVAAGLKEWYPEAKITVLVDNHPLPERELARRAGLGFIGKNGCLIHPLYGSYVFIGLICLSVRLPSDQSLEQTCLDCGACVRACPTGALANGFQRERCLSDLTQQRSDFSQAEAERFEKSRLIWGCDRCQEVCPHNRGIPLTPLAEFGTDLIPRLTLEEIAPLSERGFRRVYREYAFSWKGKKPLLRNLLIKEEIK